MTKQQTTNKTFSKKELANLYNISSKTFKRWLETIGIKNNKNILTPKQVNTIFEEYGCPF